MYLSLILLGLFVVVDALAGFRVLPLVSVSEHVWALEHRFPSLRALVGALCALLGLHLTYGWPLGP